MARLYLAVVSNPVGPVGADGLSFQSAQLLNAVRNSLIVGAVSTVMSTIIGTLFALAVARGDFPGKRVFDALFYLPVIIPDITQGVALAVFFNTFFAFVQNVFGVRLVSGFATIIIAHIAFNIAYVAVVVRARLATMDGTLEEAARDLGANHLQTFWHITFPALVPGILGGALLAFTISLDDFVVTFFTAGVGTTTLPTLCLRPPKTARTAGNQRGVGADDFGFDCACRVFFGDAAAGRVSG